MEINSYCKAVVDVAELQVNLLVSLCLNMNLTRAQLEGFCAELWPSTLSARMPCFHGIRLWSARSVSSTGLFFLSYYFPAVIAGRYVNHASFTRPHAVPNLHVCCVLSFRSSGVWCLSYLWKWNVLKWASLNWFWFNVMLLLKSIQQINTLYFCTKPITLLDLNIRLINWVFFQM